MTAVRTYAPAPHLVTVEGVGSFIATPISDGWWTVLDPRTGDRTMWWGRDDALRHLVVQLAALTPSVDPEERDHVWDEIRTLIDMTAS